MEIAPEFGGGHGGGGSYDYLGAKPVFEYEEVERFTVLMRRHYLRIRWVNERGETSFPRSNFLGWNTIHEMCRNLFPTKYLLNFKYHVCEDTHRIEFYRKSDAMLFKLKYMV